MPQDLRGDQRGGWEKEMQRKPVSSSNVASIGYDVASQTLEVEFNNGRVYQYLDVPQSMHEAFMQASSKGGFLNEHIKGSFDFVRM